MIRHLAPSAAFLAAFLLLSGDAKAFCRRRVTLDSSANCGSSGAPLWWRPRCLGYHMNVKASSQVGLADAIAVMDASFNTWSKAACTDGTPSILVSHLGTTTSTTVGFDKAGKNENIVVFHDDVWPHEGSDDALALTTFTYEKNTGEVFDADIEINSVDARLVVSGKPPPGRYELQSILTHEAGHFFGMGHTTVNGATMFPRYDPGTDGLATLESDDVQGMCAVYLRDFTRATGLAGTTYTPATETCDPVDYTPSPATTTRLTGCNCELQRPGTPAGVGGVFGVAALGALARRRRRAICS